MKEFLNELIIIGTSLGTLICREFRQRKKLAKLNEKINKDNK